MNDNAVDDTTNAPELPGQSEASKASMREFLDSAKNIAAGADAQLDGSGAAIRTVRNGKIVGMAEAHDADRVAIMEKVGRFLDSRMQGPMFIGSARGKLFVGEYPRQQDILDVQMLGGVKVGSDSLTVGQVNRMVVDELRKVLLGWIPVKSPKAHLLRANIDRREEWERLGITLNPVDWMASRDPYLLDDEVRPLWEQYQRWKVEVEPTKDDFDFYYGLM